MSVEFHALSHVVPVRNCNFLRHCKQLREGTWALVDISIDGLLPNGPVTTCRKRPSGCIVQALPNGYSKIIWIEHVAVQDQIINDLSKSIIRSGYAYGAKHWISTLERQCERISSVIGDASYPYDLRNLKGRQNLMKLGEKMILKFFSGISAACASHSWKLVSINGDDEPIRIMVRDNTDDPESPWGVFLNASISLWIPVPPEAVFHYLRNKNTRAQWDILTNGGTVEEMAYISNGKKIGNCVTLLLNSQNANQGNNILILQETSTTPTSAHIVYTPIDVASIKMIFEGVDHEEVKLLPSGFTILPSDALYNDNIVNGTLLTIAFQTLVDSSPSANLSVASLASVDYLVRSIANKIKTALSVLV
ncbi:hypothetical protein M9H77_19985 [Catharanthus roseus]|uniref:Uncharacterized protein n=1 Tax=Catharanthus roseus TaxID=4058 RepID=A0ACC0AKW3_CATRO|nr:hypothetical protein M9H77_19985 [Catharanthus roseus]